MATRPSPLRLTGYALAQVALAVPTLAAAVLVAVGALAGWLPARRAARLDPATVLRDA